MSTKISRRRKRIIAAIFALFFNTPYSANIWSTSPPKKPKKKGKFEIALKFRVHGITAAQKTRYIDAASPIAKTQSPRLSLSLFSSFLAVAYSQFHNIQLSIKFNCNGEFWSPCVGSQRSQARCSRKLPSPPWRPHLWHLGIPDPSRCCSSRFR